MAELFADFEVNREPRWPVISRLLAGSVGIHLLAGMCVFYIPGVRDAFNIASLVAGTSFVDKPYARTEIGDEVQLVDISREKFHYPEGYFAIEGQGAQLAAFIPPVPFPPQIIKPVRPMPAFKPQSEAVATPRPSPIATPSPSPVASASPSPVVAKAGSSPVPAQNDEKKNGAKLTPEEAQTELEKTVAKNNLELPKENEINKKALKDFALYANDLKNRGQLDLNKPFEIVIEAELDGNGKLKDPKFTKKEGDPNLIDLFGRMIGALNDSGFLVYLKPIDKDNPGSKVVFTIKQGENEVLATVESEASSVDSARVLAKGFNAALSIGAESRAGKDEEVLLRNTSAAPLGKKLIFNFTMPRQAVVDLIKKQLAS
ncbi:MAG: hypothetical protein M3Y84_00765 [Acidobacteriota bacterium]|nr:hypothetical protein [Acidobacteriota bacterium]